MYVKYVQKYKANATCKHDGCQCIVPSHNCTGLVRIWNESYSVHI